MASPASSTRSAARATYSAYRRIPIRWRLAGGSAVLTLVILCGFAVLVGVLTTRQIRNDFHDQVSATADESSRLESGNSLNKDFASEEKYRPSSVSRK